LTFSTAVTLKNSVLWDVKPQFVLHGTHITFPLQSKAGLCPVRFEIFTAVTTKTDYEEREVGGSERHYGWGEQNISSVLKVPRHCPFVLLVSVSF
jgi:hypothetical protein